MRGVHGQTDTPTWRSWKSMMTRCTNPNHEKWPLYGGRGIAVCERWAEPNGQGFVNFLADMGERPAAMTLDRIDGDGNYEPDNVRWADTKTQRANRRDGHTPAASLRERRMTSPEAQEGYHAAAIAAALGDTVRRLRLERGWTQKQLGKRARLTQSAVARLEAGDGIPTLRVLERVATALDATVDVTLNKPVAPEPARLSGGHPVTC